MDIIETKVVRTETTKRIELGFTAIRRMLEEQGVVLPSNAKIVVEVPCGGDWSNTELDIDDGNPVVISWSEVKVL